MSTLERAIAVAAGAHAGQVDKAGAPYILHPLRVMQRLDTVDERIAGVLHDVVEDSELTLDDLAAEGFSADVLAAIEAVTRRPEESYEEFVGRAGAHPIGRRVKQADLEDNCDLSRLAEPSEADFERRAKYRRALAALAASDPNGGYCPVITTYLEMHSPTAVRPRRTGDPRLRILEATVPQWQLNRFFYYTVGEEWGWTDRRVWTDHEWRNYVESDGLRTYAAYYDGSPAGYYELHRTPEAGVEIAYFGLMPAFIGRGFGAELLTDALETAWSLGPHRVWVHTCTLDHPSAIANYQARGMTIYRVETEG